MIHQFVFDLGRVLLRFEPEDYLRAEFSEEDVRLLMANIFRSSEWLDLDRGVMTEREAFVRISGRIPSLSGAVERILREWPTILTPIGDSIALLREVRAKGYGTYLLSNFHERAFRYVRERFDFFDDFDGLLVSYEAKLLKPDPAIFDTLRRTFAIDPAASIFIDDHAPNIIAGASAGFHTVHYHDPAQCRRAVASILLPGSEAADLPRRGESVQSVVYAAGVQVPGETL
jgi:HAD superfamily hydrolase (TIGR01509 family)